MADKSQEGKKKKEEVNISLSKSSVPTDLSKYPKVTVGEEEKGGQAETPKEKNDEIAGKDSTSQTQEDINVLLSKSSVPTDLSKYPKIKVSEPSKEEIPQKKKISREEKSSSSIPQKEDINVSLSKSSVPTDLSKYPKITVGSDTPPGSSSKKEGEKNEIGKEHKEQSQENISVSLSKTSVPTDLSKYPKITVDAEKGKMEATNVKESKAAGSTAPVEQAKDKPPPVVSSHHVTAKSPAKPKKPIVGSLETQKIVSAQSPPAPGTSTPKRGNESKGNQTVHLKKNLKVTLRKSARALDLTKYPKVVVEDDKDSKSPSAPPGGNEVSRRKEDLPKVKFADHVSDGSGQETVHLQQNLKLSLSSSENAVGLSKYQKVSVPPSEIPPKAGEKVTVSDAKQDTELPKTTVDSTKISSPPKKGDPAVNKEKITVEKVEDKKEISAPPVMDKESKGATTPAKRTEIPPPPPSSKTTLPVVEEEDLKVTLKKSRKDFAAVETKDSLKPSVKENAPTASSIKKPKQILTHTSRSIPKIVDPTKIRDDVSPKRQTHPNLTPAKNDRSDKEEPGSDTVVLKVIKEKKKKLAGILSASQTIRLRPAGESGEAPSGLAGNPPLPSSGTSTERIASKKTLKLKSSVPKSKTPESTGAIPDTVQRSGMNVSPPSPTGQGETDAGTPKKQETVQLGKSSIKRTANAAPKATLKIKVPSPGSGADGPERQLKATLKIKAPKASPSGTSQQPSPSMITGQDQSMTQQTGGKSGRTLKLKAAPRPQTPPQATQLTSSPITGTDSDKERSQAFQPSRQPEKTPANLESDVSYTISAAAALIAMSIVTFWMISQFTSLFL